MSIYIVSDAYANMTEEEFLDDLERFYSEYVFKHRIDDIVPKEVFDVYALYICRYLEYADKTFDIRIN